LQNSIFDLRSRTFVVIVIAFVILSLLVHFNITEDFDKETIEFFQSIAGNSVLDFLMQAITEAGDLYYMLGFSIILLVIRRTRRIGVILMILLVMSTLLTGYIKCGMDRDRPELEFLGDPFLIESSPDTFALFCEGGFDASFPSGHAGRAMVFGVIFGYLLSDRFPRGSYLLLLYPLLMSISRIYVLQHYPTDVIGGAILGLLLAGVVAKRSKLKKLFKNSKT